MNWRVVGYWGLCCLGLFPLAMVFFWPPIRLEDRES